MAGPVADSGTLEAFKEAVGPVDLTERATFPVKPLIAANDIAALPDESTGNVMEVGAMSTLKSPGSHGDKIDNVPEPWFDR